MLVVVASEMGMCFGVRDALEVARQYPTPKNVTIHGELVHNEQVTTEMANRGYRRLPENRRWAVPTSPEVLVTAHGISHSERQRLESAGKKLIDTTCPLVRRAHKAALRLNRLGYFVVVVGRHGHVEVEGLVGDLDHHTVVAAPEEVKTWNQPRIGIINQTTTRPDLLAVLHERIRQLNPESELEFIDTICRPTRERQTAVSELIDRVQALVVVGGKNSNNTKQLGKMAAEKGLPWLHIQSAADLDPEWFRSYRVVGLTAGTSTPDETIHEIYRALMGIAGGKLRPQPREAVAAAS